MIDVPLSVEGGGKEGGGAGLETYVIDNTVVDLTVRNLRITDTLGTSSSVHYSEVSFAGRFFTKMLLLHPHR